MCEMQSWMYVIDGRGVHCEENSYNTALCFRYDNYVFKYCAGNYRSGELAFIIFYFLLEVAVFIMEAALYTWYLKKKSQKEIPGWKPGIYALTANAASFALGLGLAYLIPGIF